MGHAEGSFGINVAQRKSDLCDKAFKFTRLSSVGTSPGGIILPWILEAFCGSRILAAENKDFRLSMSMPRKPLR